MDDRSAELRDQVRAAAADGTPLRIVGGDTKHFLGRATPGEALATAGHRGIVHYEPTELVVTARAGTPLAEIDAALAEHNQILGFEPPHLGAGATVGGTVACNLSGPRRAYAGAARDFVLGTKLLNGRGEILSFGGEVMKNVAGYDVSRLMAGAMGTLGVLLEVSLRVIPRPETHITLARRTTDQEALFLLHRWAGRQLPITATCFHGDTLYVRLCGTPKGVAAARQRVGGELVEDSAGFWHKLREQRHAFFTAKRPIWRLSVASDAPPGEIDGKWLYEWGGAQRWLVSNAPAEEIRAWARAAGGHATLVHNRPAGAETGEIFQPLAPGLLALHRRLKAAFDPAGILNPGRLYAEL